MSRVVLKPLTPLMRASAIGHFAAVKGILSEGADVNVCGPRGCTALMFAAGAGYLEIVQELVKHGADVEIEEGEGWTALRLAEDEGHFDVVRFIKGLDMTQSPVVTRSATIAQYFFRPSEENKGRPRDGYRS